LEVLCAQFDLDVLYYFERKSQLHVNLMLFFVNGRRGVGGRLLRYTDSAALKTAMLTCLAAYGGQLQHLGGYPADYPCGGPHVLRMVDAGFVL
jgi:hypothetical protein